MNNINFYIKTNKIQDYIDFINESKKHHYAITELANDIYYSKDIMNCAGIGLFVRMPDHIKNIDELNTIKFEPQVCVICSEGDGVNGSKRNFINIKEEITNFDTNLIVFISNIKKELNDNLNQYPKFIIGTECMSDIDKEYGFYKQSYFEYAKIIGYSFFNSKWYVRTNKGYSTFKSIILK